MELVLVLTKLAAVGVNLLLSLGYIIVFCKIEHFLSLYTVSMTVSYFSLQVKGKSQQNNAGESMSEVSPKDPLKDGSDEEGKHVSIPEADSKVNHLSELGPSDPMESADDTTIKQKTFHSGQIDLGDGETEKQSVTNDLAPDTPAEGEDGWQPVHRPRSAGLYGRRVRQRRQTIGKVFGYKKEDVHDMDHNNRIKNNYQSSRVYLLKKRAMSPGSYADYYVAKSPSPATKFGRRIVRAVTYRVKSVSSSVKDAKTESSQNGNLLSSSLQNGSVSSSAEGGQISSRSSIVNLGRSPSYKEVAVAPPGTIPLLQVRVPQNQAPFGDEIRDNGQQDDSAKQCSEDSVNTDEEKMNEEKMTEKMKVETARDLVVDSVDNLKDEKEATSKKEEILLNDLRNSKVSEALSSCVETGHTNCQDVEQMEHSDVQINSKPDSATENVCEKNLTKTFESENNADFNLQGVDDERIKPSIPCSSDARESTNKKLSALAAPFNPSPSAARIAPLPVNITLPAGPGSVPTIGPWPMNVPLHPGPATVLPNPICSSPHHPYPSPPATPNMIHTLPIMYPPYNQHPTLPSNTFPVTSGPFHPNHFIWQRNMNPGSSDYIPVTVWPACHPIEFSVSPPVVEPISESPKEQKGESFDSEIQGLVPNFPADLNTGAEDQKEIDLPASEAVENLNEMPEVLPEEDRVSNISNSHSISFPRNQCNDNPNDDAGKRGHDSWRCQNNDNEKTFNILIRGKRNRKQTLRMPISLLKRPYSSQSFKVVCSRVIRETETPTAHSFPSNETANVTAAQG